MKNQNQVQAHHNMVQFKEFCKENRGMERLFKHLSSSYGEDFQMLSIGGSHGNFYTCAYNAGIAAELRQRGYETELEGKVGRGRADILLTDSDGNLVAVETRNTNHKEHVSRSNVKEITFDIKEQVSAVKESAKCNSPVTAKRMVNQIQAMADLVEETLLK